MNTACGKGIHGENHIWMGLFCRSAQDFHCLHARLCHNAGSKGTHFPALLSVGAHQMARNVKLLHRLRPERIRRDAAVAEAATRTDPHASGTISIRQWENSSAAFRLSSSSAVKSSGASIVTYVPSAFPSFCHPAPM